jgi:hypothetical protein
MTNLFAIDFVFVTAHMQTGCMYSRHQKCPDTRENLMGNRCFRKAKKWSNFHSI